MKTLPIGSPIPLSSPAVVSPLLVAVQRGHLDYIDGLRGLAITMVVFYHLWFYGGASFQRPWNLVASGHIGVNLLLVLSGFCLYWPFVKAGARPTPTLMSFWMRRARRILPPYYVALVIFGLAGWALPQWGVLWPEGRLEGNELVRTLGWHTLMVHNLRPEHMLEGGRAVLVVGVGSEPLYRDAFAR